MINRGKIINGLECCMNHKSHVKQCGACPYRENRLCEEDLGNDIFALLKEQEPVEPAMDEDTPGHWVVLENCSNAGVYCSECNTKIFDHYPMKKKFSYFCPHCGTRMEGQVVKWE